jgi:hypothetical protein
MQIDFRAHIFLLFLPLILANVYHMVVVKQNVLPKLAHPISSSLFGTSKTWRGFVILPLVTAILTAAFNSLFLDGKASLLHSVFLGFGLGFSYMLWELPNSYIKRRIGIAQGQKSTTMPLLQVFTDKADSLIGVFLFYYWMMSISFREVAILFAISILIHMALSYLLFVLRIKKSF